MTLFAAGWALLSTWAVDGVTAEAIPLSEAPRLGCLAMTSAHILRGPGRFGGYSGMHLDQEHEELLLLADEGRLLRISIALDEQGAVSGVSGGETLPVLDPRGRALTKSNGDMEALVPLADGYLVTRELIDDVLVVKEQDDHFAVTDTVADLSGTNGVQGRNGYEAAAGLRDGRTLLISEPTNKDSEASIILLDGETIEELGRYTTEKDHAATDIFADHEGDRLFVLERAYSPRLGSRTRITVLSLSQLLGGSSEPFTPMELGRLAKEDRTDNMEGLAYYRSSDGGENVMIISDNNFNPEPRQHTVLMTFRLKDTCPL